MRSLQGVPPTGPWHIGDPVLFPTRCFWRCAPRVEDFLQSSGRTSPRLRFRRAGGDGVYQVKLWLKAGNFQGSLPACGT